MRIIECFDDQKNKPVRNGMSSDRVLSTPSANAIVDNFLMLFKRNYKKKRKRK